MHTAANPTNKGWRYRGKAAEVWQSPFLEENKAANIPMASSSQLGPYPLRLIPAGVPGTPQAA